MDTSPLTGFLAEVATIPDAEAVAALVLKRVDEVRASAATDDVQLRAAIGLRVASLNASAATATADQAAATAAATAATTTAAAVKASTPAVTVAYMTSVRDQIEALWTAVAALQTWRAQMDTGVALTTTATADLATVVATKL